MKPLLCIQGMEGVTGQIYLLSVNIRGAAVAAAQVGRGLTYHPRAVNASHN